MDVDSVRGEPVEGSAVKHRHAVHGMGESFKGEDGVVRLHHNIRYHRVFEAMAL